MKKNPFSLKILYRLKNALLLVTCILTAIAGALITQGVVFVLWIYAVINFNPEEIMLLTAAEWQKGIVTAWHCSTGITANIVLFVAVYLLINLVLEEVIRKKEKTNASPCGDKTSSPTDRVTV